MRILQDYYEILGLQKNSGEDDVNMRNVFLMALTQPACCLSLTKTYSYHAPSQYCLAETSGFCFQLHAQVHRFAY